MKKVINETEVKNITGAMIKKILTNETLSKSKKMIAMFELGMEVKEIANIMTEDEGKLVRYNFVYNVVSNYSTVNAIKTETNKKEGKKDLIIAMYLDGKTNKEISIDLRTNYNYVFNTIKDYKIKNNVVTKEVATTE
jgi:hypothetical protein